MENFALLKTLIKIVVILSISLLLCELKLSVNAQANSGKNFILPKTFKINDKFLPPLDAKIEHPQSKSVSTGTVQVKVVKPNSAVTSTQPKKTAPVAYRQPASVVTTASDLNNLKLINATTTQKIIKQTSANNNNIKSVVVQTNPLKTNSTNKVNNSVSLTNLIKNYRYTYADTLKSTITAFSSVGITLNSYNTERGQIIAKLPSGQEIFILVAPFNDNSTYVRVTPTDGNYNIPMTIINELFLNISNNLSKK